MSVFDHIKNQPNVVDVVCPAFMAKLETLQCGIDLSNSILTDRMTALEKEVKDLKQELLERGERTSRLARAVSNEQITVALTTTMSAMESRFQTFDSRLETIESRFETIESRFETMANDMDCLKTMMRASLAQGSVPLPPGSVAAASSTTSAPAPAPAPVVAENTAATQNTAAVEELTRIRSNAKRVTQVNKDYPGWQLKKNTKTVHQLLEEWYESAGSVPAVVDRNRVAGARWRLSTSFYKRRCAIIKFIDDVIEQSDDLVIERHHVAVALEKYMSMANLKLNGLGARLQTKTAVNGVVPSHTVRDFVKNDLNASS
ncbi:hypothetical protein OY671_007355 [Metschnikowia pulcherrima]|nr:hypothetical protein OY671_007355 [Metschnikowia pulcherrima]